jgi:hypothetical protein
MDCSAAAREGFMATVVLEPQNTEYKVHKALLIDTSDYFKKALEGPWKEAEEQTVIVKDVESDTCKHLQVF